MSRFRIEGTRLSGYTVKDTETGRLYYKKGTYSQPYKILGAARKRAAKLEDQYRERAQQTPRAAYASTSGVASWNRGTVLPTPKPANLLPDDLFTFE